MRKLYFLFLVLAIFFISKQAYSLSSSSYLIANSAIMFFDYEEANNHFDNDNSISFNNRDLEKKLLSYVNANFLNKASKVAKQILQYDKANQEAWLVYLTYAKVNNLREPFINFKKENVKQNLDIIELIFFDGSQQRIINTEIARSILETIETYLAQDLSKLQSYDYYIFYLFLSLNLDSTFDEAYFYLAQIYQKLKIYDKAEMFYSLLRKEHPLYIESQKNIALNKRFKNIEEAEKDLIFLLNFYPGNQNLLIALADLYRSSKQYKKAIPFYSKILNNNTTDRDQEWRLLYMRGICYERIDNWQSAEEDFLEALKINPESHQVLNYLAYAWIEQNIELDLSLEMLKKAYKNNPESYYILDSLAWAHFKKNNLSKAAELMEEVLHRAPGEAISIDHLGDIYFAMGRKREAFYMWKQAKDLAKPDDGILDSLQIKIKQYNAG